MKTMTVSHLILIGTLLIVTAIAIIAIRTLKEKLRRAELTNEWYSNKYLRKAGYTALWSGSDGLNYDLRSFDGGKTWYAIDHKSTIDFDKVVILGKAEEVYPGLIESMEAVDRLVDYAKKNGPIGSKMTPELETLIEDVNESESLLKFEKK